MSFLLSPFTALFGGLGGLLVKKGLQAVGVIKKKKPAQAAGPAVAMVEAMRNRDREALEQQDQLRRRRGSAADMITGTRGAEAAAGSIGRLVVGS